jgi:Protein of unknown function (DUF998)
MTRTLLIVGEVAALVFVAVLLIEGALRRGYDPAYHTSSALSLGDRGWIQIANFLQLGVGTFAFSVGVGVGVHRNMHLEAVLELREPRSAAEVDARVGAVVNGFLRGVATKDA